MMQCSAHCDKFVDNRAVVEWIFARLSSNSTLVKKAQLLKCNFQKP